MEYITAIGKYGAAARIPITVSADFFLQRLITSTAHYVSILYFR